MNKISVKNKPNKYRKITSILLIIAWLALAGYIGFYFWQKINHKPGVTTITHSDGTVTKVDETPVTEQKKQEYVVPADQPRYLSVEDMGISNARITKIGLVGKTNQLDAPISIYDAGWYVSSAKPGAGSGAVLVDGHNGGPNYDGIFKRLGSLRKGAKITIERGDGNKFTYQVIDNREMLVSEINDPNNKYGMSTMLNSIDPSKEGLNIITCVGDWLQNSQTFNKRVMLRAVRIS